MSYNRNIDDDVPEKGVREKTSKPGMMSAVVEASYGIIGLSAFAILVFTLLAFVWGVGLRLVVEAFEFGWSLISYS